MGSSHEDFFHRRKPCDYHVLISCIESAWRSSATRAEGGRLKAEGGTGRQERSNVEAGATRCRPRGEGAHDTTSLFLPDHIPFPRLIFIERQRRSHEKLRWGITVYLSLWSSSSTIPHETCHFVDPSWWRDPLDAWTLSPSYPTQEGDTQNKFCFTYVR